MANQEHKARLQQSVWAWNQWRKDYPNIEPDLTDADLTQAIFNANLRYANLSDTDLSNTHLSTADLSDANLHGANLRGANLSWADLRGADLRDANLSWADLRGADLSRTNLSDTDFNNADLRDVDLKEAICGFTVFAYVDLSTTKGLDTVIHHSPSSLSVDTLFQSKGMIPEIFLRGCGVPQTLIKSLPSMLEDASKFYSCFISYSHSDKDFAQLLYDRLWERGIVCWLDEHQLNPGDKLHSTIYEAIRLYDKVILCCSETALKSWWVGKEFENAVAKEEDYQEDLLIPLSLDNYLFEQSADEWLIGEIRKKRLVQSFVNWKDHDTFEAAFEKVVKALRTDGGKPPPPTSKLTRRT